VNGYIALFISAGCWSLLLLFSCEGFMRSKAQETVLGRGKKAKNKRQQQNWQQHPTFQTGEFEIWNE
jgi:hypothetical protein